MEENVLKSLVSMDQVKIAIENLTGINDPEIVDVQVQRASKAIEGIASTVLRAKVAYRCESDGAVHTKSYVIKRLPPTQSQLEIVKTMRLFEKESCYFRTFQPFTRRLAEGKFMLPTPESDYSISNGTDDAIFLDDLRVSGYRIPDQKFRFKGLDLPHCEVAMKLLGRLHGLATASEKLIPEGSGAWETLCPALFKEVSFYEAEEGESPSIIFDMVENSMKTIVELSKEIQGLPKEAAESGELEKLLCGSFRLMCELTRAEGDNVPKVLCHGDFWMNNLMFRYDETGVVPLDGKAIDFQVANHSHPCTDIMSFLYGCTGKSFREQHMDHLLEVYHKSMADTMEQVDMGPLFISLEELKEDAHGRYKTYGAVFGALWRPALLLDEIFRGDSAEGVDEEALADMLKDGNSALVRKKFAEDQFFRKEMTDIVQDIVEAALPNGLEDLSCSPFRV